MTDNDIIAELSASIDYGYNDDYLLLSEALDLISCQKAEIERLRSADVAPVRHGHWVDEYDSGYTTPHCSECGEIALTKEETSYDYVYSSYCPNCGAKMDEKEREENA